MKRIFLQVVVFSLLALFLFSACTREYSCEGCNSTNKPPVAVAGTDQALTLPVNSTSLDGSRSSDPDQNITSYLWTKISGPSSFSISTPRTAQTQLTALVQGVYLFELKVSDAGGLVSKDTVQIKVAEAVVAPSVDTTFRGLEWAFWHPPGLPLADSSENEIYIALLLPTNLLLNVPDSKIRVFLLNEASADWVEVHRFDNAGCSSPYMFKRDPWYITVYTCPPDYALDDKKASVRVVIN